MANEFTFMSSLPISLVCLQRDDMAPAQKRDLDGGKIYFWAQSHVVPLPPNTKSNLSSLPTLSLAAGKDEHFNGSLFGSVVTSRVVLVAYTILAATVSISRSRGSYLRGS